MNRENHVSDYLVLKVQFKGLFHYHLNVYYLCQILVLSSLKDNGNAKTLDTLVMSAAFMIS